MQFKVPKLPALHLKSENQTAAVLEGLQETHPVLRSICNVSGLPSYGLGWNWNRDPDPGYKPPQNGTF